MQPLHLFLNLSVKRVLGKPVIDLEPLVLPILTYAMISAVGKHQGSTESRPTVQRAVPALPLHLFSFPESQGNIKAWREPRPTVQGSFYPSGSSSQSCKANLSFRAAERSFWFWERTHNRCSSRTNGQDVGAASNTQQAGTVRVGST